MNRYAAKLAAKLFDDESQQVAFLRAIGEKSGRRKAVIHLRGERNSILEPGPREWPDCCYLVPVGINPGTFEEHTRGELYALDPSSVFEGGILQAVPSQPDLMIDVCAAPGGKSILAAAVLRPRQLVANEVVGKRLRVLRENLDRCQIKAETRSTDVRQLAKEFADRADLVLVDAPCSGQSILVKGGKNPGCFNPRTVETNAMRQRKIISYSAECVRPGGWLLYTTCTFSPEENEDLIQWFLAKNAEFRAVDYPKYMAYLSKIASFPAYREHPHSSLGVGGFACLLRRSG